ncbi:MAG: hypothetical protein ACRDDH_03505 [Cetobacterium sp.]|uniref:hypothetical protein n=1 Tax=Cetobacterium sp. TaxID=2071632 RepID=UPI003EE7345E
MKKIYIKEIVMYIIVFFMMLAVNVAADEIVFARHLWSVIGFFILICWTLNIIKKILSNFFKDLDEFSKK